MVEIYEGGEVREGEDQETVETNSEKSPAVEQIVLT